MHHFATVFLTFLIVSTLPGVVRAQSTGQRLVVGSLNNDAIIQYRPDGAAAGVFAQFNGLDDPRGLAYGADRRLYVGSGANDRVLRYNGILFGAPAVFVAPGSGGLDSPRGITFGPDGHLYVSSSATDTVLRYHGATGAFLDTFVAANSGGLDFPRGLTFGPDGHLYVASINTNQILRYDGATGASLGTFASAGISSPFALTFGGDGNLYVSSSGNNHVHRYAGGTGADLGAFVPAGSGGLDAPTGLTFGRDGHLYVGSFNNDRVLRYDGATGAFIDTFVAANSGGLNGPDFLVFTPPGSPTILNNGPGDGTLTIGVDGFGSFGSGPGANTTDAVYDPVGAGVPAGTTFDSGVAIRIGSAGARSFLTSGEMSGTGGLDNPAVVSDGLTASSSFTFGALTFGLVQTLSPLLAGGTQVGSQLTQVYTITNPTDGPIDVELLRYIDGDLLFNGTFTDGGGRLFVNGVETLFETDSATGALDPTTFVGITAEGGLAPALGRFELSSTQASPSLRSRIVGGGALGDVVVGDGPDADQFIDAGGGYDVNMALRNLFALGPGEQTRYTTTTIFGSVAPEDTPLPPPPTPPVPAPPALVLVVLGAGVLAARRLWSRDGGQRGVSQAERGEQRRDASAVL